VTRCWRSAAAVELRPKLPFQTRSRICGLPLGLARDIDLNPGTVADDQHSRNGCGLLKQLLLIRNFRRSLRLRNIPTSCFRRPSPLAAPADTLELGIQQLLALFGRRLDVRVVAMPTPSSQMLLAADIAPAISTAATRICGSRQRDQNQRRS
jgi:hypothetical protein